MRSTTIANIVAVAIAGIAGAVIGADLGDEEEARRITSLTQTLSLARTDLAAARGSFEDAQDDLVGARAERDQARHEVEDLTGNFRDLKPEIAHALDECDWQLRTGPLLDTSFIPVCRNVITIGKVFRRALPDFGEPDDDRPDSDDASSHAAS